MSLGGSSLSMGLKRPAERGTPTLGCNDAPDSPVPTTGATTPIKVNICGSILPIDIWRMCRSGNIIQKLVVSMTRHRMLGGDVSGSPIYFFPLYHSNSFHFYSLTTEWRRSALSYKNFLSFFPLWVCRYSQIDISLSSTQLHAFCGNHGLAN